MTNRYLDENGLSYFWNKIKGRLSNKEVMLRKSETHIQWKYFDDVEWTNLVAIDDLKGEDGVDGAKGEKGEKGESGVLVGTTLPTDPEVKVFIDISGEPDDYVIPVASSTILGGIKVGENLKIDNDGVLSIDTSALQAYVDESILGGES